MSHFPVSPLAALLGSALVAAGLATATAPARAETLEEFADRVAGTVHVCSSCHGRYGRSTSPTFPNLAGQQKEYLVAQLKAFRDKSRADPHAKTYMFGMAARLDDSLIEGLADYFAKQRPAEPTSGVTTDIEAGRKIFEDGVTQRDVPACSACHGAKAEGAGAFPRLASQHPEYLINQLNAFQSKSRNNDLMHDNSKNLTQDDIREVAAFFGALP
jgi:cytochrome c553